MSLPLLVYVLAALSIVLLLVDCLQTRYIAKHPEHEEGNVVLGAHPSLATVHVYFAFWIALVAVFTYYLAPDLTLVSAQLILIAVESYVVYNNHQKGIGLA